MRSHVRSARRVRFFGSQNSSHLPKLHAAGLSLHRFATAQVVTAAPSAWFSAASVKLIRGSAGLPFFGFSQIFLQPVAPARSRWQRRITFRLRHTEKAAIASFSHRSASVRLESYVAFFRENLKIGRWNCIFEKRIKHCYSKKMQETIQSFTDSHRKKRRTEVFTATSRFEGYRINRSLTQIIILELPECWQSRKYGDYVC